MVSRHAAGLAPVIKPLLQSSHARRPTRKTRRGRHERRPPAGGAARARLRGAPARAGHGQASGLLQHPRSHRAVQLQVGQPSGHIGRQTRQRSCLRGLGRSGRRARHAPPPPLRLALPPHPLRGGRGVTSRLGGPCVTCSPGGPAPRHASGCRAEAQLPVRRCTGCATRKRTHLLQRPLVCQGLVPRGQAAGALQQRGQHGVAGRARVAQRRRPAPVQRACLQALTPPGACGPQTPDLC